MKIQLKPEKIRIKGLKISEAEERIDPTGEEMIPFQDGDVNGKIKLISFKEALIYIFDPVIKDGKVRAEDYINLRKAIEDELVIYVYNRDRSGLVISTENAIVDESLQLEMPNYIKEEGSQNITTVEFESVVIKDTLEYTRTTLSLPILKTTGDGDHVLTDNGKYVYIGDLALTNIKISDGTNTPVYDLVTEKIRLTKDNTPCITWTTTKEGNDIKVNLFIAKATQTMDGLMSKEDKVKLDVTIPGQITDLNNQVTRLDGRIDKEITDRTNADTIITNNLNKEIQDRKDEVARLDREIDDINSNADDLEAKLQQEIQDRQDGDTTITNNLNAFINTKGRPGGLASLNENGTVPSTQLPSYVDDVVEVYAVYDRSDTGEITNIKLYHDSAHIQPVVGEEGKIYVNINQGEPSFTFRWSGSQFTHIDSSALVIGDITGTAFDGGRGKALENTANALPDNILMSASKTQNASNLVLRYGRTKKGANNIYGNNDTVSLTLEAANATTGGILSADDYKKLQEASGNYIADIDTTSSPTNSSYGIEYTRNDGSSTIVYFDPVDDAHMGLMTPEQLDMLQNLEDNRRTFSAVTRINYIQPSATDIEMGTSELAAGASSTTDKEYSFPAATSTSAGVMVAADKKTFDSIPYRIGIGAYKIEKSANYWDVYPRCYKKNADGVYEQMPDDSNIKVIFTGASTSVSGLMTSTDKNQLTVGIPNQITNIQNQISNITAGTVSKVTVTGSGNAINNASITGSTLTLNKDATFNNYVHPAGDAVSKASGFYKFATDSLSHVRNPIPVTQADITALGIPSTTTADAAYVKKAGDTMNGWLRVKNNSTGSGIMTEDGVGLLMYEGETHTEMGMSRGITYIRSGEQDLRHRKGSNNYLILDTSNYKSYAAAVGIANSTTDLNDYNGFGMLVNATDSNATTANHYPVQQAGSLFYCTGAYASSNQIYGSYASNRWFVRGGGTGSSNKTAWEELVKANGATWNIATSGNAGSATKLATPRTIWGQSFDGTNNVSGAMSQVTTIEASGRAHFTGGIRTGSNADWTSTGVFAIADTYPLALRGNNGTADKRQYYFSISGDRMVLRSSTDGNSFVANIVEFVHNGQVQFPNYVQMDKDLRVINKISAGSTGESQYGVITIGLPSTSQNNQSCFSWTRSNQQAFGLGFDTTNRIVIGSANISQVITPWLTIASTGTSTNSKVTAAGGFWKESDARLKTDIKPLEHTLEQICSIPTASFILDDKEQIGTIAQELEANGFEKLVCEDEVEASKVKNKDQFETYTKDEEEYVKVKKVEYEMLSVIAIEGVKLLKEEIDKLKAEIANLKKD